MIIGSHRWGTEQFSRRDQTMSSKVRQLRDRLIFIRSHRGMSDEDAKKATLEYMVSFIEFLEANNPKITDAIVKRLKSIDTLMSSHERAAVAIAESKTTRRPENV